MKPFQQKSKSHPLLKRIEKGEGLHLDFKYQISDASKIARSLSAFANTAGGSLLVGVKDNGSIGGISSAEELHMIEQAAHHYCQPEVSFRTKVWNIKGKKVLEIIIPKGEHIPYKAPDKKGIFKAFVRIEDENILACGVQMKVWAKLQSDRPIRFYNNPEETILLKLLKEHQEISVQDLQEAAHISKFKAENLLSNFIVMKLAEIKVTPETCLFRSANPENDFY